jgi:hypothetical protein
MGQGFRRYPPNVSEHQPITSSRLTSPLLKKAYGIRRR